MFIEELLGDNGGTIEMVEKPSRVKLPQLSGVLNVALLWGSLTEKKNKHAANIVF